MIKLAILSDIHVGLSACSKDLCPKPLSKNRNDLKRYDAKVDDSYKKKFIDFINKEGIRADYLVLPGDLTETAHPGEIDLLSEFIKEALEALGVDDNKVIFTPGNHDVDWSQHDPKDTTGLKWEKRYDYFNHNKFPFKSWMDNGIGTLFSSPYFTLWDFDDLLVLAYNSAHHDNPSVKKNIHHGLADPDHILRIDEILESIVNPEKKVKLFLAHHHIINFSNPIPEESDFSIMINSEGLLEKLHEKNFDLIVHGHMHFPRFEIHSNVSYPPLPILCSGSFSIEIDTKWAGTIANQFHLIEVHGREGTENAITGKIISWTNVFARGWIPSEEPSSGIHHIIPFGTYLMPTELDTKLQPFINNWFKSNDHILWSHITSNFPELLHLPLPSAINAFERISLQLNKQTMVGNYELIMY